MGDSYVLCEYCLLLQYPGMPKHEKDSWQSTRGSHAWSLQSCWKYNKLSLTPFSTRTNIYIALKEFPFIDIHISQKSTRKQAASAHMSRSQERASDLESNMPRLLQSQTLPGESSRWRSPGGPRNSTSLLETATILALLQLSKEAKFASSRSNKLEILENLENVLDTQYLM